LAGQKIRKSLDLTSWEAAQNLIREWESAGKIEFAGQAITVQEAVDRYFQDCQARHLKPTTQRKLGVLLKKQLPAYCQQLGIRHLFELETNIVRDFRSTWKDGALNSQKKLESLRSFFKFCIPQWIATNPAIGIKPPKVTHRPMLPFSREEMAKIVAACEQYPNEYGKVSPEYSQRVKAFVLLLRYSGLRISDAVQLRRDRLQGSKLFLYTHKTGTPVCVPLPNVLIQTLKGLPGHGTYFFWSGKSKLTTATGNWRKYLERVFDKAQIKGNPHRFRDTFAVELLLSGVPIDQVSVLLGHSSIKITEMHYSPWVRARQEQLEEAVKRGWNL
jgi:integrase